MEKNPGKGVTPPLHHNVVIIEKGAFRLPSATTFNKQIFALKNSHVVDML